MKSSEQIRKNAKYFPLSDEELQHLSDEDSGIILQKDYPCRLKLNYSCLPVNSKRFNKAVTDELNENALKYNCELDGLVLRYCNYFRPETPIEATRNRKLNVTCLADIYIFKPQCNSVLTGTVNKKSKNHIGCIIYNVFNVSIIKPTNERYIHWPGKNVNIGDLVTFRITKLDMSEIIPYIFAELVQKNDNSGPLENDEGDSGVGADCSSLANSEERCSDLDVFESFKDVESKKRKRSDTFSDETKSKKRKLA